MAFSFMPTNYQQAVQPFLAYLQYEKRYSQHTLTAYRTDLEQFFNFLTKEYDTPAIESLTHGIIRSWLAALKNEGLEAKSINRKMSSLKSFFRQQMRQGLIKQSPMAMLTAPKIKKRLPVYVEQVDINTLLQQVPFEDTWQGKTDKLIISLFYQTGMRSSELTNLKESQLDAGNNQIKVLGKGSKERLIPVSSSVMNDLLGYIASKQAIESANRQYFFIGVKGKPLYPKYVYNVVHKYLGLVTTIQQKSPHILRHSFATHLMNNGAELNAVKSLLGHSSLAATQVYTHNTIDKLKLVYQKAHPKA